MSDENSERHALEEEAKVRERRDDAGALWKKVYFGGGEHLNNWLEQSQEIAGEENVKLEKVETTGLACFNAGGEGLYRIWVRVTEDEV